MQDFEDPFNCIICTQCNQDFGESEIDECKLCGGEICKNCHEYSKGYHLLCKWDIDYIKKNYKLVEKAKNGCNNKSQKLISTIASGIEIYKGEFYSE